MEREVWKMENHEEDAAIFDEAAGRWGALNTQWDGMDEERGGAVINRNQAIFGISFKISPQSR